jgi:tetratricopeptide (TPR) repeat protein
VTIFRTLAPAAALLVLAVAPAVAAPREPYRALLARADSFFVHQRGAEGAAYLDSLVGGARARGDSRLEAAVLARRAAALVFVQRFDDATRDAARAESLAVARRDTLTWGRALVARGRAALFRDRLEDARPIYPRLLRLGRAIRDARLEGNARLGQAYLDLKDLRYTRAAAGYRAAIRLLGSGRDLGAELSARVGLARTERAAGHVDAARAAYVRVIARAGAVGDLRNEADAWNNLGVIESLDGDPDRAAIDYGHAIECNRRMGRPTGAQALNLGILQTRTGDWNGAVSTIQEELARGDYPPRSSMACLLRAQIATARLFLGDQRAACSMLQEQWAMRDSLPHADAGALGVQLVRALSASGRPVEALAVLDEVSRRFRDREMDVPREQFAAIAELALNRVDAALEHAGHAWEAASDEDSRLQVGPTLLLCLRAAGDLDRARRLSRDLTGLLEARRRAHRRMEWNTELEANLTRLATATADVWLDQGGTGADSAFDALERLRGATAAFDTLPVGAAELTRVALRPGDCFLELFVSGQDSLLIALRVRTGASVRAARLPSSDPANHDRIIRFVRESEGSPDTLAALALLRRRLGDLTEEILTSRRVYLSLPANMAGEPLGALAEMARPGRAPRFVLVPSATWLTRVRAYPRSSPPHPRVVVLARSTSTGGKRIPGVLEEAGWLRTRYDAPGVVHAGSRELAEISPWLGRGDLLHVAAHSQARPGDPWGAALLLGRGDGDDAWLSTRMIAKGSGCAPIVMLATCNATLGSGLGMASVHGIASGFLARGARAIVTTLWDVDDRATARFTRSLYASLELGRTIGEAVEDARRRLAAEPETASPRLWAAYALIGDPDVRMPLTPAGRGPLPAAPGGPGR